VTADKKLAKLTAYKMEVNTEAIARMIADNEHNKYTMLYYLLERRSARGDIDLDAAIKEIDERARAIFQSDNEKTAEIRYRPSGTLHQRTDSLQLRTLKTLGLNEGPRSDRKLDKPSDIVLEFKEKITFNSRGEPVVASKRKDLTKKRSIYEQDTNQYPATAKASKSEGKQPTKIGVSL
jgi:hypothetical protein